MASKEWTLSRLNLPASVRGLGDGIGQVTFLQGHLLVVAAGNVYSLMLDTNEADVKIRAELLGPLGKVHVKSYG